jgi:hypothetical protein
VIQAILNLSHAPDTDDSDNDEERQYQEKTEAETGPYLHFAQIHFGSLL